MLLPSFVLTAVRVRDFKNLTQVLRDLDSGLTQIVIDLLSFELVNQREVICSVFRVHFRNPVNHFEDVLFCGRQSEGDGLGKQSLWDWRLAAGLRYLKRLTGLHSGFQSVHISC